MLIVSWWLGCARIPDDIGDPVLTDAAEAGPVRSPPEALADAAQSEDPRVRARAIAYQIAVGGAGAADAGLRDESDWVRFAAVDALGGRGDDDCRVQLLRVVADPSFEPAVRARAAMWVPTSATAQVMAAAASKERNPWRAAPMALAAVRLGEPSARDGLYRALASGEFGYEITFFQALADSADPSLVPSLREAYERAEPELLASLAAVRAALGDGEAGAELRRLLGGPDDAARMEVVDLLVRISPDVAASWLTKAAERRDVVGTYAALVGAARAEGDAKAFVRAATHDDPDMREVAQLALAYVPAGRPTGRYARTVLLGLEDEDARVRSAACRVAGALRLSEAAPLLHAALTDESGLVRVEAAGALLLGSL